MLHRVSCNRGMGFWAPGTEWQSQRNESISWGRNRSNLGEERKWGSCTKLKLRAWNSKGRAGGCRRQRPLRWGLDGCNSGICILLSGYLYQSKWQSHIKWPAIHDIMYHMRLYHCKNCPDIHTGGFNTRSIQILDQQVLTSNLLTATSKGKCTRLGTFLLWSYLQPTIPPQDEHNPFIRLCIPSLPSL